jgi:hypothetical protein
MKEAVVDAIAREYDHCNGDCDRPASQTLRRLAEDMSKRGYCAAGPWPDALAVVGNDGLVEEYHAVAYGSGGFTDNRNGKFITAWLPQSGPVAVEGPWPSPRACHSYKFNLGPHNGAWDSTFICIRSWEYCDEIGLGYMGNIKRASCPVRAEGRSDNEREIWERIMIGEQQWWCDGERIESLDNPAQASCRGHVKTCTEDGTVCAESDW